MLKNNQIKELILYRLSSTDDTKLALQRYFDETFRGNESGRFSGFFVSDMDFEIRSIMEMIVSSKPYRKQAYISGSIISEDKGKTILRLIVRNNYLLTRLHLLPFVLGVILIVVGLVFEKFKVATTIGIGAIVFYATGLSLMYIFVKDLYVEQITRDLKLYDERSLSQNK